MWLDSPRPQLTGHVWPSPVSASAFMALLCYKNGSLTRERVRDSCADGDWAIFNQLIDSTPRGNFGNIGAALTATAANEPSAEMSQSQRAIF